MMWSGFEGMGWGWIGLGFVHMIVFWGLVILAFVGLMRWLAGETTSARAPEAIEILKTRYARGELTREQFEQMKRELAQ